MHRQNGPRDSLIALFLLGAFFLLPPFLLVFNRPERALGIPVLYLHLFLAWGLLIALGAAVAHRLGGDAPEPPHDVPDPASRRLPGGADCDA